MFPLRIIALLRLAWLACFLAAAAVAAQNNASTSAALQAHASDKFDIELVKEIRQRLADGTFEIDYNKVAGNLLGDAVAAVRAGRE